MSRTAVLLRGRRRRCGGIRGDIPGIASRHWSGMDDSCHLVHAIGLAWCMPLDSKTGKTWIDEHMRICARAAFHCIIHQVTWIMECFLCVCWCNAGAFSSERVVASTPALTTIDNSPIYICALRTCALLGLGLRLPRPLLCLRAAHWSAHSAQSTMLNQCALRRPHTGHERRDSRESARARVFGLKLYILRYGLCATRDAGRCGASAAAGRGAGETARLHASAGERRAGSRIQLAGYRTSRKAVPYLLCGTPRDLTNI